MGGRHGRVPMHGDLGRCIVLSSIREMDDTTVTLRYCDHVSRFVNRGITATSNTTGLILLDLDPEPNNGDQVFSTHSALDYAR